MSKETSVTLNTQTLIGFTAERGHAWHYRAEDQGTESNHYDFAIPVEDVRRRLFSWEAMSGPAETTIYGPNGEPIKVSDPTRQLIVRPDFIHPERSAILGQFRDGYAIHQYSDWLLGIAETMLDDGDDLAIGSAGLLESGGMAWVQVDLPDTIVTAAGDNYRVSLLCCTSHNGKLSTTFKLVITRIVCDNTLGAGLAENGAQHKTKHSRYSDLKIADLRDALGIVFKGADSFEAEMNELLAIPVPGGEFVKWLDATVPMPEKPGRTRTMAERKREEMMGLYMTDERVAPWGGTAWGVVQTDNTWRSHFSTIHKGTDRGQRNIFAAANGKSFDADAQALATLKLVLAGADPAQLAKRSLVSV